MYSGEQCVAMSLQDVTMSSYPYTGVTEADHRYEGSWFWSPRTNLEPIPRLKAGWNLVEPKYFAYLFYSKPRDTFIGNQHGRFSVTRDTLRNSVISQKLFNLYFAEPHCPYATAIKISPYNPEDIKFKIVLKPIEELWFLNPQLFFEKMDATEARNRATAKTESALSVAKAEALVRANTPSIEKIKSGLQAQDRATYVQIKSEILELISEGKIAPLSNLEVERITLMRMVEFKGMIDVLNTDTHATVTGEDGETRSLYTREAVSLMNLMRQIGNEAQRMAEGASTTKKNGKSAFQALEELVKSGMKVEISPSEDRKPIDATYRELLDEKEG